jgi:hypothetical protein
MPQETHDNQKATSPSPTIQRGVDKSWGEQQKATTDPKEAIADKHTNHPVTP